MKTIIKILVVLLAFTWISCEESSDPVAVDESDLLLGYWTNREFIDTLVRYERAAELKENIYGIGFKVEHVFVERKNEGWCGTPPVTLRDFEGTWTKNDSLVDVDVPYWCGMAHYTYKIIELDNSSLTLALVWQEYEQ